MASLLGKKRSSFLPGARGLFILVLAVVLAAWLVPHLIMASGSAPLPPCASDDGSGPKPCYWDAQHQGNGQGQSFISH